MSIIFVLSLNFSKPAKCLKMSHYWRANDLLYRFSVNFVITILLLNAAGLGQVEEGACERWDGEALLWFSIVLQKAGLSEASKTKNYTTMK